VDNFDRIQHLHRLLLSHCYPVPINKIAEILDCTRKTAKIAIDLLRDQLHAPIMYCQQSKGWLYKKNAEVFELPGLWLTADELHSLAAILNIFKTTDEGLLGNEINSVRKQVKKLIDAKGLDISHFNRTIKYLTTSKSPVVNRFFSIITKGLINKKQLVITYSDDSGKTSQRDISPQTLIHYQENWYLNALCHKRNALRSFMLPRIIKVITSDLENKAIAPNELRDHYQRSFGIFSGKPKHNATLIFYPPVIRDQWHPEINKFFDERKETWLKKNIHSSLSESEIKKKEHECNHVFSLEQWLPNAAKRAGQISISTHPCTFSHPSSRKNKNGYVSPIIANAKPSGDGYLRSGNVVVNSDALGNAATLDVYKFLTLVIDDGKNLLTHIEEDSQVAKELLGIESQSYVKLKDGFLAMLKSQAETITSSKIKQVYFPVQNNYHLLSLLTPSGAIYELRKRVDDIRFSEKTKEARACKKNNGFHQEGYRQIYGLTTIGYGGTKPQNISVLNNQNGGKSYLLASLPPALRKLDIQFPITDFFSQSISHYQCKDLFQTLHKLFVQHQQNYDVRAARDACYQEIIDRIVERMWAIRSIAGEQYNAESSQLNKAQKVWLCPDCIDEREQEDVWLDDLLKEVSQFILNGYEKSLGKKSILFSDEEYKQVHQQAVINKESLR
jgi:CRISPR-associated protein Csy1